MQLNINFDFSSSFLKTMFETISAKIPVTIRGSPKVKKEPNITIIQNAPSWSGLDAINKTKRYIRRIDTKEEITDIIKSLLYLVFIDSRIKLT